MALIPRPWQKHCFAQLERPSLITIRVPRDVIDHNLRKTGKLLKLDFHTLDRSGKAVAVGRIFPYSVSVVLTYRAATALRSEITVPDWLGSELREHELGWRPRRTDSKQPLRNTE